jgi:hypothetical protein
MIHTMLAQLFGPRYYLPLALFLCAAAMAYYSVQVYSDQVHQQIAEPEVSKEKTADLKMQEIQALFSRSEQTSPSYENIAQNNLFLPERTAWSPPTKETAEGGQGKDGASSKQGGGPDRRKEVRLYGTTIMESEKRALLFFEGFSSKKKYRLVKEGGTARDEGKRGDQVYFRLKAVNSDSVTLEDFNGNTFDVGLYEHERSKQSSTPKPSQATVVIGGTSGGEGKAENGKSGQKAGTKAGGTSADQSSEEKAQSDQGAESSEAEADEDREGKKRKNPFELLKEMAEQGKNQSSKSDEEKERLVEEGKMRKVETPFGTIYRPAE